MTKKERKVVAVVLLDYQGKFLILKRSYKKKLHPNIWNLPSGGVEQGETLRQAAQREVAEETELKMKIKENGPIVKIETSEGYAQVVHFVLAELIGGDVKLNEENSDFKWVTPVQALRHQFAIDKSEVEKILKQFRLF